MKKLLLVIMCLVFVYTSANAKEGNNSRIQNLEAQVAELQNRLGSQSVSHATAIDSQDLAVELCNLFVLTGKTPPLFCRNCGNGSLELIEQCDDGNAVGEDGCSADCIWEVCGNSIIDPGEECDDGNDNDSDMCNSSCTIVYKTVFVTSQVYSGNLGGLAGADAKCSQLAEAAGLPGEEYIAWLSDSETSASERLPHDAGNYILVNGTPVAKDWDDLTKGTISGKINLDENFDSHASYVWTNTKLDGQIRHTAPGYNCNNWMSGDSSNYGGLGSSNYNDKYWTERSLISFCDNTFRLYCFEK